MHQQFALALVPLELLSAYRILMVQLTVTAELLQRQTKRKIVCEESRAYPVHNVRAPALTTFRRQ